LKSVCICPELTMMIYFWLIYTLVLRTAIVYLSKVEAPSS